MVFQLPFREKPKTQKNSWFDQMTKSTGRPTLRHQTCAVLVIWSIDLLLFAPEYIHSPSQKSIHQVNWPNDQIDRRINRYITTSPGWSPKLHQTLEKRLTKWPKRQKDGKAISVKLLSFWSFGRSYLPPLLFFCPGIIVALVLLPNLVSSISQTPTAVL